MVRCEMSIKGCTFMEDVKCKKNTETSSNRVNVRGFMRRVHVKWMRHGVTTKQVNRAALRSSELFSCKARHQYCLLETLVVDSRRVWKNTLVNLWSHVEYETMRAFSACQPCFVHMRCSI
jgi:hypothetical protein